MTTWDSRPAVLAGLVGSGIGASLTPALHEREGAEQGLRSIYRRLDLERLGLGAEALPELLAAAERTGTRLLVTADHGNCEMMIDPETGGPHTAHTTNPVPLVLFDPAGDAEAQYRLGLMYFSGKGVPENEKKSYDLLLRSATQRDLIRLDALTGTVSQAMRVGVDEIASQWWADPEGRPRPARLRSGWHCRCCRSPDWRSAAWPARRDYFRSSTSRETMRCPTSEFSGPPWLFCTEIVVRSPSPLTAIR